MKVQGRIWKLLPVQEGVAKSTGNPYRRQDFVVEFFEDANQRFPDRVPLSLGGQQIDEYDLHEGEEVIIGFEHRAREYDGRFYPEFRIFHFEKVKAVTETEQAEKSVEATAEQKEAMQKLEKMGESDGEGGDLSF